jgi:hypothetical protein
MTIFSSNVLGALAAIFTALAAIFGLLAFGKSYLEGKEKDAAAERYQRTAIAKQTELETLLSEQRGKTAKSELALADVRRQQRPRAIDEKKLIAALRGKPQMKVEILFQSENPEAFLAATVINRWLGKGAENDGAGWDVIPPRPINRHDAIPEFMDSSAPPSARAGAWYGAGIVVNSAPSAGALYGTTNPVGSLMSALAQAGLPIPICTSDARMPADTIRLVIGSKM